MENLLTDIEQKELNKFGKLELTASHVYLHLANRMKSLSCFGAEKFFMKESSGEVKHYRRLEEFANSLGGELSVESLEKVDNLGVNSIKDALEISYQMEKDLLLAYEEAAKNTNLSLKVVLLFHELVTHQVAAVGEFSDLIARAALTNDMLLFDKELA
jgi:ferritin